MTEKLASAEIDESRERFEKFFNRQELGHQLISNVRKTACWETYQQAERDTRERCAQLHTSIIEWLKDATSGAEKCVNPGMRLHGYAGAKVLIEHLERIRGVNR